MFENFTLPLPHSQQCEEMVLGCCILSPELIDQVAACGLDLFYVAANRATWDNLKAFRKSGQCSPELFIEFLRQKGTLDNCGGEFAVASLLDIPSLKMFDGSMEMLRDKARRREFWRSADDLKDYALDETLDIQDSIHKFDERVSKILDDISPDTTTDWKSKVINTLELIQQRYNDGGKLPGLSTGFKGFDTKFNGFQGGKIYAFTARPGCGKTTLVCNLIENVVYNKGIPGVFTLEMLAEDLVIKLLAKSANIDSRKLESGRLTRMEFNKLIPALTTQKEMPIQVDDGSSMTIEDVALQTRRWVKEEGVNIIFLDYAQLVKGEGKQHEKIDDTSKGLKAIAKTHNIPVIVLAQMNREGQIKGSGAIEEDADVVTLLEPANPEEEGPETEIKARIVKCRGGDTGTLYFNFVKPVSKFEEL